MGWIFCPFCVPGATSEEDSRAFFRKASRGSSAFTARCVPSGMHLQYFSLKKFLPPLIVGGTDCEMLEEGYSGRSNFTEFSAWSNPRGTTIGG